MVLKKGKDADQCSSYQPIIVSCFMKLIKHAVFPEILTKCNFSDYQVGFRAGFGCSLVYHILAQLLVSAKIQNSPLIFAWLIFWELLTTLYIYKYFIA